MSQNRSPQGVLSMPRERSVRGQQARWWGEQQPAPPVHLRHDRPTKGIRSLRPSDVVISSRSLPPLIRSLRCQRQGYRPRAVPPAPADRAGEIRLVQFGPVIRGHQQFMAHKGFGGAAANTFKPHHKQRLAGQLPAFFELDFRRLTPCDCAASGAPVP